MAVIKSLPATKTLKNQLEYLAQEGKTLEHLRTGINCTIDNVEVEFNIIKEIYNKPLGKQYYHLTQSFSPIDDITYEKAHAIGKEWIEKYIQGHQIYMVTHIDRDHIHTHFVINSVHIDTGLKLQITPKLLELMKIYSNEICSRENLSTINLDSSFGISKTDEEYRLEKRGIMPWKEKIRKSIDIAKESTKDFEEFKQHLVEKHNIEVLESNDNLTFKTIDENKIVRDRKLGGNYKKSSIMLK